MRNGKLTLVFGPMYWFLKSRFLFSKKMKQAAYTLLAALAACILVGIMPAVASDYTLPIFGNANMDEIIDEQDIEYLQKIISGANKATKFSDANHDGKIDENDISQIKLIIRGEEKALTIIDAAGRTVTIKKPIERIASYMPAERLAVRLGAVDKLVGVCTRTHRYARNLIFVLAYPELKGLPDVGDMNDPNKEAILSLDPDLILGWSFFPDTADSLQKATGIPVLCYDETSTGNRYSAPGGPFETWRLMGYILDKENRAEQLISYTTKEFDKISKVISKIPEGEKRSVYFASSRTIDDITQATTRYEPIEIAGGINVANVLAPKNRTVSSWVEISKEQVIKWNPDIILIQHFPGSPIKVEKVQADPLLQTTKAAKNKHIYNTMGAYMNWDPARGIAECFYLAKLFYPEMFDNLNVEEEGNTILKTFYGGDNLFTWTIENFGNYTKLK